MMTERTSGRWWALVVFNGCLAVSTPSTTYAQPSTGVQSTFAVLGEPFNVGRIELSVPVAVTADQLVTLEVSDNEGRISYPATRNILTDPLSRPTGGTIAPGEPVIGGGRLLRRVGDLVRQATAPVDVPHVAARELMFLFRGDGPLQVRVNAPDAAGRTVFMLTPVASSAIVDHSSALNRWWGTFSSSMTRQIANADYPTIVESYLVSQLAGRLNLPLPVDFIRSASDQDPSMISTLKLLAGTEQIRSSVFQRVAIGSPESSMEASSMEANLPLPYQPRWRPAEPVTHGEMPAIEPLASRVPPECFYIRYGSFTNYLWFRDLTEEYGGDIGKMVALRGSDDGAARRVEDQLNLKMTALSRMLGSSVIEDQAIIGRDLFLSEGASLGVLFRSRNGYLLSTSLNSDRVSLSKSDPEVNLTTETILGRDVTFLYSLDNRIRSFMVVDGDTIFVTNSRTLAERFIEVGEGGESLATTPEFILSRQLMPLERDDTLFIYFSPAMLRGLVSPQYLIEIKRRLRSSADVSLVRLARLVSEAEGNSLSDPDDLIDAGYLPRDFGIRSDGSGVIAVGDQIIDSLRGRPGTLLPIADVKIDGVTAAEQQWYARVAAYHETQWQQIDPIFVGIRRTDSPDGPSIQRLDIHAEMAPFVPDKYGSIAKQLGPPTRVKIDFAPDDIVAGQAHVASDQLGGTIPPHHLFAAIKDTVPPAPEELDGILKTYQALRVLPGYLGAWPQPGLIDRLPLGLGRGQPVGPGLSRLIGGVYRYQGGGFSIVSFQSDVLMASLPFLVANETDDAAQVRVRVGDLRGSQLEGWVNNQVYQRSVDASRAGADFLTLLSQLLKVPPTNATDVASHLLGGQLQDPLGGKYVYAKLDDRQVEKSWMSDAWKDQSAITPLILQTGISKNAPPHYVAPMLNWFRGGHAKLTQYADRLVADVVLDIERRGPVPAPQ
jgi:hypothetical protein